MTGLTPIPCDSGESQREQGIGKDGSRWIRGAGCRIKRVSSSGVDSRAIMEGGTAMRFLGALTALFAALLIGVLGFPTYSPPFLRLAVAVLALAGSAGGVLLAVGQPLDGWSRRLALAFTVAVVVFGVLLLVQGALSTQTLGAALRYQIFSTLPALVLAVFLFRQVPSVERERSG